MKVIDLNLYRTRKAIIALEEKIGRLALSPGSGTVREMKSCFKEWLKVNTSR
jgi:hypothetical protein